ncbi:lasso RiPP family leader peptide-containing protein [Longimicrobium sp.]|nr:lasso RiPP family leader peptide-containing protein [Longimicrobium sp.]HSU13334.1 lasso RiPP family leader peptide-containing protein [Longimicrobium sp.]
MQLPTRKSYQAPALKVYGDARALTQTAATNNNMNDPGNSSQTKT